MWEGKWLCTSSISTIFSFHWGKVLFHSCHFRSFISWGQPRLAVPSPHQHSYQWKWRQHCLQLGVGGITWFREGIYNKVALTVGLKTFTQVYISTSATAIQAHRATKQRAASPFVCLDVGHRLKREGGNRNSLRWSSIHEIILALPAVWVSPLPHPQWDSR